VRWRRAAARGKRTRWRGGRVWASASSFAPGPLASLPPLLPPFSLSLRTASLLSLIYSLSHLVILSLIPPASSSSSSSSSPRTPRHAGQVQCSVCQACSWRRVSRGRPLVPPPSVCSEPSVREETKLFFRATRLQRRPGRETGRLTPVRPL